MDNAVVSRRTALASALGLAGAAALPSVAVAGNRSAGTRPLGANAERPLWANADPPIRLALPAPAGPCMVGRTDLHLVDAGRTDPWLADGSPRELMVSLWYPAVRGTGTPAPYMLPGAAAEYGRGAAAVMGIE